MTMRNRTLVARCGLDIQRVIKKEGSCGTFPGPHSYWGMDTQERQSTLLTTNAAGLGGSSDSPQHLWLIRGQPSY